MFTFHYGAGWIRFHLGRFFLSFPESRAAGLFAIRCAQTQDPEWGRDSTKAVACCAGIRLFCFLFALKHAFALAHKKTAHSVSGFCSRGGRIRTCDLLVPNQAP